MTVGSMHVRNLTMATGYRPVRWALDGTMTELTPLQSARLVAINAADDIVGLMASGVVVWPAVDGVPPAS